MLGTGTGLIRAERRSPAVLIESKHESVVVDCGWGVPDALTKINFPLHTLGHICITHSHADHMSALPALLQSLVIANIPHLPGEARQKPLYLHGYPGFAEDIGALTRMMVPELRLGEQVVIVEHGDGISKKFGGLSIAAQEIQHIRELRAVAFRISDDVHSVAVSGDLGWDERFAPIVEETNLAVLDASVSNDLFEQLGPRPNHLSAVECGMWAARAGLDHLVLTSLYDLDKTLALEAAVRQNYQGKLTIPHDLQEFEL